MDLLDPILTCKICFQEGTQQDCIKIAGKDIFHIKCFTCTSCKISLVGQLAFEHDGKYFCQIDYASLFQKLTCNYCAEPISTEYCRVANYCFHQECLKCFHCKNDFTKDQNGNLEYFPDEDKLICKTCHQKPSCYVCREVFTDSYIKIMGKKYHKDCFRCEKCETKFENEEFFRTSTKALCEKCYKEEGITCYKCNTAIMDKIYNVSGHQYHFECLSCKKCDKPFGQEGFVLIGQDPYHKECYDAQCILCNQKCADDFLLVEATKSIHRQCLPFYQQQKMCSV